VVLIFNAHLVKCRLKYGLCNPPLEFGRRLYIGNAEQVHK